MSDTPGLVFLSDMEKKPRRHGFFGLYGKLIVLLLLCVLFAGAVLLMLRAVLSYRLAGREYDALRTAHVETLANAYENDPPASGSPQDADFDARPAGAVLKVDFATLSLINPDIRAWLHFPALDISYPVVWSQDRAFYMTHTFEKSRNANGAIFIESFNDPSFSDKNTFLYGHNSADGSMFGRLHELQSLSGDAAAELFFYVYRADGTAGKYRVYSYYVTEETSDSFSIPDDASFASYYAKTCENAEKKETAFPENPKELVTLSACYGREGTPYRFLVHGVRTD